MLPGLGLLPDIRLPTKMRPEPSGCSSGSLERAGREGNLGCKCPPPPPGLPFKHLVPRHLALECPRLVLWHCSPPLLSTY